MDNQSKTPQTDYKEFDEKIASKYKWSFALGSNCSGLLSGIVYTAITFYFNTKLGMNENLLGIAWLLFGIWNTISGPLLGWISDNTRTRLGRRIPYIRYGSIFYGIFFLICWIPLSKSGNQWVLFADFLIVLSFFDIVATIIGICYGCLPTEMVISAYQRASVGIYNSDSRDCFDSIANRSSACIFNGKFFRDVCAILSSYGYHRDSKCHNYDCEFVYGQRTPLCGNAIATIHLGRD